MTDHFAAAQQAAEEHLEACDAPEEEGVHPDTLAPYCGCYTCIVREVLHAAYPHLRAGWDEESAERWAIAMAEYKKKLLSP